MKIPTVQIVGHETIKPSSPTPPHLRSYKLCWIDQQTPLKHLPVTLLYSRPRDQPPRAADAAAAAAAEDKIAALRAALSQTLTRYYPLAGRQSGDSLVDCADDGVGFYEARADVTLSDVLGRGDAPDGDLEGKLMPCGRSCCGSGSGVLLSVQVTAFVCGGVAVGVCLSHKIADGRSMVSFLLSWAAAATGRAGDGPDPLFDAADALPPSDDAVPPKDPEAGPGERPQVVKRFPLDPQKIAALRSGLSPAPTRVQAVTALLWRSLIRALARTAAAGPPKVSVASLLVDTRARTDPPAPDHAFGNRCVLAAAGLTAEAAEWVAKGETDAGVLEEKLGSSVKEVVEEYARRLQGANGPASAFALVREAVRRCGGFGGFDVHVISSWLRLPVYEVDFGWGRPAWVGIDRNVCRDGVVLLPGPPAGAGAGAGDVSDGRGVEAWVSLSEAEMAEFEKDADLTSCLKINS